MRAILVLMAVLSAAVPARAGEVLDAPPATPDPQAHYLFYMHGLWLEDNPESARNRQHGAYDYQGILDDLAERGFVVISEKREAGTPQDDYVAKLAGQVDALLGAGVPAARITVSGFSKGGAMALSAGAALANPEINYVVMAGCGTGPHAKGYERFLRREAAGMRGRYLSLYDGDDEQAGTCQEAFAAAGLADAREMVLEVGSGHGAFYRPLAEWIDPLTAWAMGE